MGSKKKKAVLREKRRGEENVSERDKSSLRPFWLWLTTPSALLGPLLYKENFKGTRPTKTLALTYWTGYPTSANLLNNKEPHPWPQACPLLPCSLLSCSLSLPLINSPNLLDIKEKLNAIVAEWGSD
jgi:hypothetical protein